MRFVDLSRSTRFSKLLDLTHALLACKTPFEAILRFCHYLGNAYPDRAHMVVSTRGLPEGEFRLWRLRDGDGREHFELRDPETVKELPVRQSQVLGQIIRDARPHLVENIDWSDDPVLGPMLTGYTSLIAVPLLSEHMPMNWSFLLRRDGEVLTQADLEGSFTRATLIVSLIDSLYVRRHLAEAHAYIDAEVARMARLQRDLLPEPIPDIPGVQLSASYETFAQVGGDLYDVIPLDGARDAARDAENRRLGEESARPRSQGSGAARRRWCVFIGDASGHGPSAAVAAAMVQATLHACAAESAGPGALFETLNRHLCRKRMEGSFVTAFVGFYDASSHRLTYTSAGHPPPLLACPSNHAPRLLDAGGGPPLGIDEEATFEEASVVLEPGQTVLLYTDGISEARDAAGMMFGAESIERCLSGCPGDAAAAIRQLLTCLEAHQAGTRPVDDQTVVAMHVRGDG